jgi:hypothetical protein
LTVPVGLWLYEDLESVPETVHEVVLSGEPVRITAPATVSALAVGYVVSRETVAATDMTDVLMRGVMNLDTALMEKLDRVLDMAGDPEEASPSHWEGLVELDAPHREIPSTAVLPALYAFFRHGGAYRDALDLIRSWGGEAARPRCRLTGALYGAFHGIEKLPGEILDALPGLDDHVELARDLFKATQRA